MKLLLLGLGQRLELLGKLRGGQKGAGKMAARIRHGRRKMASFHGHRNRGRKRSRKWRGKTAASIGNGGLL